MLCHVLQYNGVHDVTIFDAANMGLGELPGRPYNLIYSFYSIGFHWSLEHFLDDLLTLLEDGGTAIFTTSTDFEPFESLRKLPHRLVNWEPVWPRGAILKFIVLWKPTKGHMSEWSSLR
jgi:hypothetical protein